MRDKLIALSMVKKGDWNEVYQFLKRDRNLSSIDGRSASRLVGKLKYDVITLVDQDYPIAWREMSKPPFVVYLKGNRQLLKEDMIGIVGGKVPSSYTRDVLEKLMEQLPKKMPIVTGIELGVETIANHCRENRVVCLASGFEADELYQRKSSYHTLSFDDLLISELPPTAKFNLQAYYRSYHLMSELSHLVCVFELAGFDLRVKYLNYLAEMGKPMIVLPDKKMQCTAGGLGLLNRGAKCLMGINDMMDYFDSNDNL